MKYVLGIAALAAFAVAPAFAQPDDDNSDVYGTVRSVDVYTGDLNLRDPRDRDEAAWRIGQATDVACSPFPDVRVLLEVRDYRACRGEAFEDALSELDARAHHLRRGHVTTREYPADELPPPPPPPDGE